MTQHQLANQTRSHLKSSPDSRLPREPRTADCEGRCQGGLTEVSVGFCKALTEATVGVFKIDVVFGEGLIGVAGKLLLMYQAKTEVSAERVWFQDCGPQDKEKDCKKEVSIHISIIAPKAQKPQRPESGHKEPPDQWRDKRQLGEVKFKPGP